MIRVCHMRAYAVCRMQAEAFVTCIAEKHRMIWMQGSFFKPGRLYTSIDTIFPSVASGFPRIQKKNNRPGLERGRENICKSVFFSFKLICSRSMLIFSSCKRIFFRNAVNVICIRLSGPITIIKTGTSGVAPSQSIKKITPKTMSDGSIKSTSDHFEENLFSNCSSCIISYLLFFFCVIPISFFLSLQNTQFCRFFSSCSSQPLGTFLTVG